MPLLLYTTSVDGHLGRFLVLAILHNAAMNTEGTCVFLNYSFFSGYMLRSLPTSKEMYFARETPNLANNSL